MKAARGIFGDQAQASRLLRTLLPALSLAIVLGAIAYLNPRAISYMGFSLMLNLAVPIMLATVAQMFVMCGNDLDLSIGPFVSFVGCVAATFLSDRPLIGCAVLAGGVIVYMGLGALIHLRRLPSVIVTLGMSFIWQGVAVLVMPQPGGNTPEWLTGMMAWQPALVPLPVIVAIVIAIAGHLFLMQTPYGAILRGAGGNPASVRRAGWSLLTVKIVLFGMAGVFGILSGLSLIGVATSADANIGNGYTLLSIAGAILGGSEFTGGRVSPVGAVIGSLTLTLAASSLLTFMQIPQDWQIGANGVILIIVLAARALIGRGTGGQDA